MKCILDRIPASKRHYFVKKQTRLPSGDRNDPQILPEPLYWLMRRPVDPNGVKRDFYGTKTEQYRGPWAGEAGKAKAEELAQSLNESFHVDWCSKD